MPKQIENPTSRLLPTEVKKSKDFPEYLLVWCPYEDCFGDGRPYLVHARTWTRPIRRQSVAGKSFHIVGRACPYCMRVAKVTRPRGG